jgi:toxin ParE1/3/4
MRIFWSEVAQRDLANIYTYVAKDSPRYGKSVVASIRRATRRLRQHPLLGAVVPEFQLGEVREIGWGNYRIFYKVQGSQVIVASVIHAARDISQIDTE